MGKFVVVFIFTVLAIPFVNGQSQPIGLDEVIQNSARRTEESMPEGIMIAVLNFTSTSEAFSDYVVEELTGELVRGRKVTIVDRRRLALIREEMNLQLSGDISDESAQAIGRQLGARSIVSGSLTNLGTYFRFRVIVINVETATIEYQISLNLRNDPQVTFLLGSGSQSVTSTAPSTRPSATVPAASTESGSSTTSNTSVNDVATPLTVGTMVPGNGLAEKLAWLQRSADSHNTYILEVNANETIAPHTFEFRGAINITIVIRGVGSNRIIRLRSHGTMFTIRQNVTFIIENNITLQGHTGNNGAMVRVNGGTFKMRTGSTITGNTSDDGGGVRIDGGTFEMSGGTISANTVSGNGGGVLLMDGVTFEMSGGTISGNTASGGGGVRVNGTFIMRGGIITGNTARENGGGVSNNRGTFTKSGGTVTGYTSDQNTGNAVRDGAGNIIARRGHAVYVNENLRKETTAGPGFNLSSRDSGRWD